MSNFSDVGFEINTEEEMYELINNLYTKTRNIPAQNGSYALYHDPSGAELWLQLNQQGQIIGLSPYYAGESKRLVCITASIPDEASEMGGSLHGWAAPAEKDNPESGQYPFVFDVPDIQVRTTGPHPKDHYVQLNAFCQSMDLYESEEHYNSSDNGEMKFASQSFIPSGLFGAGDKDSFSRALGTFTGIIRKFEKKKNVAGGGEFYWLLVDTLGGNVDVVADIRLISSEPKIGGVVQGQFWMSGRILNSEQETETPKEKSFFRKLFGK